MLIRRNHPNPVREQWARTLRWFRRLENAKGRDAEDFALVVLQQCWAMQDWMKKSLHEVTETSRTENRYTQRDVEQLYQSIELRLCRDLANGSKHLDLNPEPSGAADPRLDALHAVIGREFECGDDGPGTRATVFAANGTHDLRELCAACVTQLREFLRRFTPIETR